MDILGTLRPNRKEVSNYLQKKKCKKGGTVYILKWKDKKKKELSILLIIRHTEIIELERRNETTVLLIVANDCTNCMDRADRVYLDLTS